MRSAKRFFIVLVTAPELKTARRLAKSILAKRLAACVNLVPKLESHYWWRGKLETSAEVLMLIKTTAARLPALERAVLAGHPYETPEFLALPIGRGSERYLDWLGHEAR